MQWQYVRCQQKHDIKTFLNLQNAFTDKLLKVAFIIHSVNPLFSDIAFLNCHTFKTEVSY